MRTINDVINNPIAGDVVDFGNGPEEVGATKILKGYDGFPDVESVGRNKTTGTDQHTVWCSLDLWRKKCEREGRVLIVAGSEAAQ